MYDYTCILVHTVNREEAFILLNTVVTFFCKIIFKITETVDSPTNKSDIKQLVCSEKHSKASASHIPVM